MLENIKRYGESAPGKVVIDAYRENGEGDLYLRVSPAIRDNKFVEYMLPGYVSLHQVIETPDAILYELGLGDEEFNDSQVIKFLDDALPAMVINYERIWHSVDMENYS